MSNWGGKWLYIYLKHILEYIDILGWTSLLTDLSQYFMDESNQSNR